MFVIKWPTGATKMGQMKTIKNEWTFAPVVNRNQECFHPLMIKKIIIISLSAVKMLNFRFNFCNL